MLGKEGKHIGKRGISPLIATVLLIGFAVAVAALVILWGTGVIKGQIEKTGEFAQGKLGCESQIEIDLDQATCSPGRVVVGVENLKDIAVPNLRGRVIGDGGASSSLAGVPLNSNEKKNVAFVFDSSKVGKPKAIEVIPVLYSGNNQVTCDGQKIAIEVDNSRC